MAVVVKEDGTIPTSADPGRACLLYVLVPFLFKAEAFTQAKLGTQNWYDPASRESPNPQFDAFRRDAPSPPALSPPSSTTSAPTTGSSNPYQMYAPYPDQANFAPMAMTPSPPPQLGYGMPQAPPPPMSGGHYGAAPGMPPYGAPQQPMQVSSRWRTSYQPMPQAPPASGGAAGDDDVIPTAIVIKNIPFAVSRDHLLSVIESLGAPLPYAFNYHHDNGVFRGLAFANFRLPEEAASVVAALNGYDVQGRKLRVEYKKVLQPGEKDKIEREKALKRMKSVQFDREMMPPPITVPPIHTNGNSNGYGNGNVNGNGFSSNSLGSGSLQHNDGNNSPPHSASSASSDALPMALDLNDPMALDIYSRVLVFKEDRMRDEFAFSRNLSPVERRIVHLVAQKLGLASQTRIDGDVKTVVVTRDHTRPALNSSNSATLSSTYLAPYGPGSNSSSGDISPSLRIKKSMPDLRGFNGPVVARDPARSLTPQRSSGNLRDNRDYSSMGASQARKANGSGNFGSGNYHHLFGADAPPVPPLPTGYNMHRTSVPSLSSASASAASASTSPPADDSLSQPLRNPRGPNGESRGFGGGAGALPHTLRATQSTVFRPTNGSAGVIGRRVEEESEDGEIETMRTRESIDI